jgi:hypothetical protein
MLDTNTYIVLAIVVVATVAIYVLERYTKGKPVDWLDATKLGSLAAALGGGVLYSTSEDVAAVVETTQEMFVGTPAF